MWTRLSWSHLLLEDSSLLERSVFTSRLNFPTLNCLSAALLVLCRVLFGSDRLEYY